MESILLRAVIALSLVTIVSCGDDDVVSPEIPEVLAFDFVCE